MKEPSMGSRSVTSSSLLFALVGLSAGALCVYAAGCGSNQTTSSGQDSGPTGPTGPFPEAGNLQCGADSSDWPMFGQNVCNTNSQAAAGGISPTTVGTLGVKWVYSAKGDVSATPTVVAGNVYFPDWAVGGGYINKVDAATGTEVWSKNVGTLLGSIVPSAASLTGFYSRNAPVVVGGNVIFGLLRGTDLVTDPGNSAYLMAISDATGTPQWATLLDSHKAAVIAGSPVVNGTTLYVGVSSEEEITGSFSAGGCCSFRGSVVALDAMSGAIKWKTYTIADSLYYAGSPDAGKLAGFAGAAIWSSTPVVDLKRNQLYVTTGNNYHYSSAKDAAEAGASEGNYVDSVIALDLDTGAVKWAQSVPEGGSDIWTTSDMGPDSDFGAGANLFTATINGKLTDVVGAGQKSGTYFAFDANTGALLWKTSVAPGGHLGGIHWGTATDGTRIYAESNFEGTSKPFVVAGTGKYAGQTIETGTWSALDVSTGNILWQLPNPVLSKPAQSGVSCNGPVAIVNGVLFAGSMDAAGTMFAINASTGDVLWQYASGGTVYGGPAISNGVVYWGSGYPMTVRPLGFGTDSMKVYAFGLGLADAGGGGSPEAGAEAGASPEAGAEAGASPEAGAEAAADAPSE
jgi:polyvinyl alcohol dehydrogenase (cytochrome)